MKKTIAAKRPATGVRRVKVTTRFSAETHKALLQHAALTGASPHEIIEAALISHMGGDDLDRRMDIINRALMQIQRRLGRLELHSEITAQTLGDYIIYWMMVNPPVPTDQRASAY